MDRVTIRAFVDEVIKIARVVTPLQPHQQRVVDRITQENQPGLVVAHGLGSGKTLTSIAAQDALGQPADVVVPAALRANYQKELKKHTRGRVPKTEIDSIQNVAVKGKDLENPVLIVDEAHRIRDPATSAYQVVSKNEAKKRLLLTGSPFYNRPFDIAPLVNVAAGNRVLPGDRKSFDERFILEQEKSPGIVGRLMGAQAGTVPTLNPERRLELQKALKKWVDYHPSSQEEFPSVERQDIRVPMTQGQLDIYDTAMGTAPAWVRWKVRRGMPPSKAEAEQLNAYLAAVRQISNTTAPYQKKGDPHAPKIDRAFDELKAQLDANPRAKAVVYSNFLDAGINPYKSRLEQAKIPYGEFTGAMPKSKRDQLVKDYNDNKIKALLLSSAGGEGLDLKGTRLIQVLEPHWNDEKLRQVEGRGVRFKSHSDLPPEERKVLIQRFLATRPRSGILERLKLMDPGYASDEFLAQMSSNKEQLNKQFRDLLAEEKKR